MRCLARIRGNPSRDQCGRKARTKRDFCSQHLTVKCRPCGAVNDGTCVKRSRSASRPASDSEESTCVSSPPRKSAKKTPEVVLPMRRLKSQSVTCGSTSAQPTIVRGKLVRTTTTETRILKTAHSATWTMNPDCTPVLAVKSSKVVQPKSKRIRTSTIDFSPAVVCAVVKRCMKKRAPHSGAKPVKVANSACSSICSMRTPRNTGKIGQPAGDTLSSRPARRKTSRCSVNPGGKPVREVSSTLRTSRNTANTGKLAPAQCKTAKRVTHSTRKPVEVVNIRCNSICSMRTPRITSKAGQSACGMISSTSARQKTPMCLPIHGVKLVQEVKGRNISVHSKKTLRNTVQVCHSTRGVSSSLPARRKTTRFVPNTAVTPREPPAIVTETLAMSDASRRKHARKRDNRSVVPTAKSEVASDTDGPSSSPPRRVTRLTRDSSGQPLRSTPCSGRLVQSRNTKANRRLRADAFASVVASSPRVQTDGVKQAGLNKNRQRRTIGRSLPLMKRITRSMTNASGKIEPVLLPSSTRRVTSGGTSTPAKGPVTKKKGGRERIVPRTSSRLRVNAIAATKRRVSDRRDENGTLSSGSQTTKNGGKGVRVSNSSIAPSQRKTASCRTVSGNSRSTTDDSNSSSNRECLPRKIVAKRASKSPAKQAFPPRGRSIKRVASDRPNRASALGETEVKRASKVSANQIPPLRGSTKRRVSSSVSKKASSLRGIEVNRMKNLASQVPSLKGSTKRRSLSDGSNRVPSPKRKLTKRVLSGSPDRAALIRIANKVSSLKSTSAKRASSSSQDHASTSSANKVSSTNDETTKRASSRCQDHTSTTSANKILSLKGKSTKRALSGSLDHVPTTSASKVPSVKGQSAKLASNGSQDHAPTSSANKVPSVKGTLAKRASSGSQDHASTTSASKKSSLRGTSAKRVSSSTQDHAPTSSASKAPSVRGKSTKRALSSTQDRAPTSSASKAPSVKCTSAKRVSNSSQDHASTSSASKISSLKSTSAKRVPSSSQDHASRSSASKVSSTKGKSAQRVSSGSRDHASMKTTNQLSSQKGRPTTRASRENLTRTSSPRRSGAKRASNPANQPSSVRGRAAARESSGHSRDALTSPSGSVILDLVSSDGSPPRTIVTKAHASLSSKTASHDAPINGIGFATLLHDADTSNAEQSSTPASPRSKTPSSDVPTGRASLMSPLKKSVVRHVPRFPVRLQTPKRHHAPATVLLSETRNARAKRRHLQGRSGGQRDSAPSLPGFFSFPQDVLDLVVEYLMQRDKFIACVAHRFFHFANEPRFYSVMDLTAVGASAGVSGRIRRPSEGSLHHLELLTEFITNQKRFREASIVDVQRRTLFLLHGQLIPLLEAHCPKVSILRIRDLLRFPVSPHVSLSSASHTKTFLNRVLRDHQIEAVIAEGADENEVFVFPIDQAGTQYCIARLCNGDRCQKKKTGKDHFCALHSKRQQDGAVS